MTTFGAPTYPPPIPGGHAPYEQPHAGPAPWSAAAIGSFVLALLGFLGVTAVLAILFAVIAFFTTSGGKRRGLGFAIAAIPISLVTGTVAVFVLLAVLMFSRMMLVPPKLEAVLNAGTESAAPVSALREMASKEFNEAASDETLRAWVAHVNAKHGRVTRVTVDPATAFSVDDEGASHLTIKAKFVNGDADMRVTFKPESFWNPLIDDIEVDGASPRRPDKPDAPTPTPP